MPTDADPGFNKPFWPTVIAASVFGGLLIIGFEIGRSAGEDKPVALKVRSTLLAKLDKDRARTAPTTAPVTVETPAETEKPVEAAKSKPKPTKAKPVPPPPTTKPAEPKPEPKKPEPPPEPPAVQVKFDRILPIFKAKCNICHGDPSIKGDLDLRSLMAIAKSPNSKYIVPGKPDDSEIFNRVKDGSMPPPGKEKLTDAEVKMIFDWIKSGGK